MLEMIQLAGEVAIKRFDPITDHRVYFIGAVGVRDDGAVVSARNESSHVPMASAHAEARLSKRLDHGATVYVARVVGVRAGKTHLSMAKPCYTCMRSLLSRKVSKIYYSIGPNEYGSIIN